MKMLTLRLRCLRHRLRKIFVAGSLTAAILAAAPAPLAETDIRRDAVVQAVEEVMPCVVNVATEQVVESRYPYPDFFRQFYGGRPQVRSSLGSGVIISDDGYMLTNLHVVNRATRIHVKLSDAAGGGEYEVQNLYVVTPQEDVALLKIVPKKKGEKFKAIRFAKDDDLLLGETVMALGNPFGLGESVSRGILSSKRRAAPKENEDLSMENWLQTDALINPGNSGGPLINLRGELIGINVAILKGAQGIGFAIPIKEVRQALGEMFNPETASRWFGAHVSVNSPLVVQSLDSHGPASQAGLRVGDTIAQINGHAPKDFMDFNRQLRENPKLNFTLTVQRGAEQLDFHIKVLPFEEVFRQRMGVELRDLTPALVDQLGLGSLDGLDSGLLVSRVEKGSPADKASLRDYFLINEIDGRPVRNTLDAFMVLSKMASGQSAEMAVLVPRTRGDVILGYQEGVTTLKLR